MKKATITIMLLVAACAPLAIADDDLTIRIRDIFSIEDTPGLAAAALADITFIEGEVLLARASAAPEDGPVEFHPTDDGVGLRVGLDGGRLAENIRRDGVKKGTKNFGGEVAQFFKNHWGKMLTGVAVRVAYHNRGHLGVGGGNEDRMAAPSTAQSTITDSSHDCLTFDHASIFVAPGATFAPSADCHDSSSGP